MKIIEITPDIVELDAVSFVAFPANETAFFEMSIDPALLQILINQQFNNFKQEKKYRFQNLDVKEFDGPSRPFCRHNLNKVFTEKEIRNWVNMSQKDKTENGYIDGYADNFLSSFPMMGYKCDNIFYNCQHVLVEVPQYQMGQDRKRYNMSSERLNLYDDKTNKITGIVLSPNQLIYRSDIDGKEGYIWFSKETIKTFQETFNNKYFTLGHRIALKSVEVIKSYLCETQEQIEKFKEKGIEVKLGAWIMDTIVRDDDEYNRIKNLGVKSGYSIEAYEK
jgi:hypothetical protein